MKKLLTLQNILKAIAAVLCLVAFFLMFTNQVFWKVGNSKFYFEYQDALFGDHGAVISFVGYLMILLGGLGMCAVIFLKDKKLAKMITICLAGALLLGAIFVFIEAAVVNGRADVDGLYHLAAGPVIAGIFAILAALLGCASEFLKK